MGTIQHSMTIATTSCLINAYGHSAHAGCCNGVSAVQAQLCTVLYVNNANGTSQPWQQQRVAVWSVRNESGSAIGSSLYINGVRLFHSSFSDTTLMWNATATPQLPTAARPAVGS